MKGFRRIRRIPPARSYGTTAEHATPLSSSITARLQEPGGDLADTRGRLSSETQVHSLQEVRHSEANAERRMEAVTEQLRLFTEEVAQVKTSLEQQTLALPQRAECMVNGEQRRKPRQQLSPHDSGVSVRPLPERTAHRSPKSAFETGEGTS